MFCIVGQTKYPSNSNYGDDTVFGLCGVHDGNTNWTARDVHELMSVPKDELRLLAGELT